MRDMREMKRGKEGRKEPIVGIRELQEFWKWQFYRESWSREDALASELYTELDRDSGASVYLAKLE